MILLGLLDILRKKAEIVNERRSVTWKFSY